MSLFPPTFENIQKAAQLLREGELVAFPTETVYGLGADAFQEKACQKIYTAKGRPSFNPLIVHCLENTQVEELAFLGQDAQKLAAQFWPGPLTLILKKRTPSLLPSIVTAGLETVAVRIPLHPTARALLKAFGRPIAAPSANRSGFLSPTLARHVLEDLHSKVAMILEGPPIEVGLESTILDLSEDVPILLRAGGLEIEKIQEFLGQKIFMNQTVSKIKSPGQLLKHYAPHLPLRFNAEDVDSEEGLLAFGSPLSGSKVTFNLSKTENLEEAAQNLFAFLHLLDERSDITGIAVQSIPEHGLGIAINDRLRRAAEGSKKI
ncbi:MAG TPA: L-threonylcarbamoyladenylate synthase [Alphaproteobacteria bacterium]|nr:L-threonylcarbamoyladenylate synthase [Alphaproteobacteria bacterium]HQS93808.1 L-threonylcarbamoyladenylate synthase [Alphaproteobacteria bacterium]